MRTVADASSLSEHREIIARQNEQTNGEQVVSSASPTTDYIARALRPTTWL